MCYTFRQAHMKKTSLAIVVFFFIASLFLYFYRFPKMLTFDADQEFYANEYQKTVEQRKLTLLGIETSIGGMFVGPLYTYFNIFVYWISKGNPLGIFLVTLIIVSSQAGLTYLLFSKLKNQKVGIFGGFLVLISAGLWNKAFAPSAINLLYPMGLLFFYLIIKFKERKKYFFWLGVLLAFALQIHFSLFFFFPIVFIFFIWQRLITKKNAVSLFQIILFTLISLSPLVIFDLRHNFFIANNFWRFLTSSVNSQGAFSLTETSGVFIGLSELFSHILVPKPPFFIYIFLALAFVYFAAYFKKESSYKVMSIIYIVSIILFLFYRGPEPDYFFYFLLAPFFFVAAQFLYLLSRNKLLKWPVYLFLSFIAIQNLQFISSTLNHYNFRLKREVARYIKRESQGKKVKISYDTELGLGFGFDYLLKYEGVNIDNNDFQQQYHIVIKNYENYPGVEFREPGSPVSIKVAKL